VNRLTPLILISFLAGVFESLGMSAQLQTDDGFRGIWYYNQPTKDEFKYKYSGGMATYPQQQAPVAVYRKEVNKTFFVYGGTTARAPGDKQELLHMVSFFDHATKTLARPRILLNKKTDDAHDNPVLAIDDAGFLWIFSPSHGTSRPSFIHRSTAPYSIDAFEKIAQTNFSYAQPWHMPGKGFLFLHTQYGGGPWGVKAARVTGWTTSEDGRTWTGGKAMAAIAMGDYQISWPQGRRLATAFDFHPAPLGLNARANIYYLQTDDFGETWTTASGDAVRLPVMDPKNAALIYDSISEGMLVYLKDINYDKASRPVILFLTSKGHESGPTNGLRQWKTTRWTGKVWQTRDFTTSDSNYDHGSLYIEEDGTWRVIAPTEPGPQPYNPGGEMVMWTSRDEGTHWTKERQLTRDSKFNHTYARRPLDAHTGFYAIWADGHGREPSTSRLYFCDRTGKVLRMPTMMTKDSAPADVME
jgi:BNR repeat-containing family member